MVKEMIEKPVNRRIIRQNIKWGFMKGKFKKEFEKIIDEFKKEQSNKSFTLDDMIEVLTQIKDVLTKSKVQYTEIFILPRIFYDYNYDDDETFFSVEIGRYETDEEVKERIERKKKQKKEADAKQLKQDAKKLLELKKKFGEKELS